MVGVRATSRASATYVVAPAALVGVLALATAVAWGDVGHAHAPDEGTQVPRVVWLLGIALTILAQVILFGVMWWYNAFGRKPDTGEETQ